MGRGIPQLVDSRRLFGAIELWAQQAPLTIAVDDGEQAFSYADVRTLAKQIAGELRDRGLQSGDIVALSLPGALSCLFIAAALHEGLVTCQLPPNGAGDFEADWVLSSSLTDSKFAERHVLIDSAFVDRVRNRPTNLAPVEFSAPDALCRIVFSSGTTGTPKPIALTCDMVVARAQAANDLVFGATPFLCTLDLASASGFHTFLGCLIAGRTYLVPGAPAHNLKQVTTHRVGAIKASPVQISLLLDEAMRDGVSLSSLEVINSAGSVVPLGLRGKVKAQTHASLVNLFGSSEVGRAAEREIDDDDLAFAGVVVSGTELEIVDEADSLAPLGTEGLVRYRRAGQAHEYYRDADATAQAFHDGWFYTGDIGRLEEGKRLYLVGRASDLINAGGVKVNPAHAERSALGIVGVEDAAGFAHSSDAGVTEFAMALVVTDQADINQVIAELKRQLGSLAPTIVFTMPALPRNAAGKISRADVAEIYRKAIEQI